MSRPPRPRPVGCAATATRRDRGTLPTRRRAPSTWRLHYATGQTFGALEGPGAGDDDAFLRAYDGDGTLAWARQFGSASDDRPNAIAANLSPLVGVLALGWSVSELMLLYWFENGIIGFFGILKILLSRGPLLGRLFTAAYFSFHYGAFWSVRGCFVVTLFGGERTSIARRRS